MIRREKEHNQLALFVSFAPFFSEKGGLPLSSLSSFPVASLWSPKEIVAMSGDDGDIEPYDLVLQGK